MRIVQAIETSGLGGAEQVLIQLCLRLRAQGNETTALLLREGALKAALEANGIETAILRLSRPTDPRFGIALRRYLKERRVEVLHSHEVTLALYGRLACGWTQTAHVATAHGHNFIKNPKRRLPGSFMLRAARRFRLAAVSDNLAERLARGLHVRRASIEVIPNGIDTSIAATASRRDDGRPLRLLAVGNLYPVKNHAFLIRVVAAMRAQGRAVELDILGRGAEEGALRELARSLGVEDVVRLHGFRDDVSDFLSQSHIFVSSSKSEGMPISFLEAMRAGLPIVSSRVGGVPELVKHGVHGFLFELDHLDEAVGCIRTLMDDDEARLRQGRAGSTLVHERHSEDVMVHRYVELYQRLAMR